MKIKADIEAVITDFIKARKKYEEAKTAIESQKMNYTPVYLNQKRTELDNAFEQVINEADAKVNVIVQTAIDKITAKKNRRTDFKDSVAMALSYINAMGDNITDEMAMDLVKPLLGDYQTMRRFYLVLYEKLFTGEKINESEALVALSGYVNAVDMLKKIQVKFDGFFSKRDTLGTIELLGNSSISTAINIETVRIAFNKFVTREIDAYEKHLDIIEAIYAENSGVIA